MDAEWIKILVPVAFLVIYALNQIFNREDKPALNRGQPLGPRPGGMPPPRPAPPREQSPPPTRWQPISPASSGRATDEVIVIPAEPSRSPAMPPGRTRSPNPPRRVPRPRPAAEPTRGPAAPTRGSALLGRDLQDVGQGVSQSLALTPLTLPTDLATAASPTVTPPRPTAAIPGLLTSDIAQAVRNPTRLREAILISELLQPPLSLRRPPRR